MIERLILATVLLIAGTSIYRLYCRTQLQRIRSNANVDSLLSGVRQDVPTIVYFTTPTCVPCKTQQQPAIQQLKDEVGDAVQIVQVDATEQPEDADRWGVLSAPTTFILDRNGNPLHVNHGVAPVDKLKRQLTNVA